MDKQTDQLLIARSDLELINELAFTIVWPRVIWSKNANDRQRNLESTQVNIRNCADSILSIVNRTFDEDLKIKITG